MLSTLFNEDSKSYYWDVKEQNYIKYKIDLSDLNFHRNENNLLTLCIIYAKLRNTK